MKKLAKMETVLCAARAEVMILRSQLRWSQFQADQSSAEVRRLMTDLHGLKTSGVNAV